ncbi:MAG TPA: NAD-dependent epimerase/dehydratase family protein, partial [Anaerolineales bacterium]|nr:NAD-dependent epimerase/dehydratase family protein [Anaerolineales bacterium]
IEAGCSTFGSSCARSGGSWGCKGFEVRVLVTGGAGFIGSHLVERLLAGGHAVRVLDNLSSGMRADPSAAGYELVEGDVRDRSIVEASLDGVEQVFHLAAMISVPASTQAPMECYEVNLTGSLQVLDASRQAGVRRVVLASSAAVYGDFLGPVAETTPPAPLSPYAASKLGMEQAARMFTDTFNLPTVCLRFFNVYGPRQAPDSRYAAVIPGFIQAGLVQQPMVIHGDGQQRRDFVFVADAVEACLLAATREQASGGVVNIGGGGSVTIQDLAGILQRLIPEAPKAILGAVREGDIRYSEAELRRAHALLGYHPATTLEHGLQVTIEWFRHSQAEMPV